MKAALFGLFCISFIMHSLSALDTQFYSQAGQDQMINILLYRILGKQDKGYYLEIGAGAPMFINNACFFEKNYGWDGVSIEITPEYQASWKATRNNPLLIQDALETDYGALLTSYPFTLDYLSLDIDNNYDIVLKRIPFDRYTFKIITIEHDSYVHGELFQKREREILSKLGYYLLCEDVSAHNLPYEDWWIHPSAFPAELLIKLKRLDLKRKNYDEIIQILEEVAIHK